MVNNLRIQATYGAFTGLPAASPSAVGHSMGLMEIPSSDCD